ncbi:MAG: gamma-butyrobetaine hydroxylase-like domain-containing protein, partial [Pseudomonadota bacterium]
MANDTPIPTEIEYHQKTKVLHVLFNDRSRFTMPAEYLRVHSPSAEVRGHHPSQAILQTGKAEVAINEIEPVGTYGILLKFDDG